MQLNSLYKSLLPETMLEGLVNLELLLQPEPHHEREHVAEVGASSDEIRRVQVRKHAHQQLHSREIKKKKCEEN